MAAFSRRDFLKLSSALLSGAALSRLAPQLFPASGSSAPNILIFVFDAMSAKHLSLYGYRRKTTPNFERFAEHATVFNRHYSAGSFTTPGTASLLTGLYPWTHRALTLSGLIARQLAEQNLFRAIGKPYHRLAFSQNLWPNYFFAQFRRDIDKVLSPASFSLVSGVVGDKISRDLQESHRAFDDFMFVDDRPPASLVFGLFQRILLRRDVLRTSIADYPRGLPRTAEYPIFFILRDVFDGLIQTVQGLTSPFLAYLHAWTPHEPYYPTKEFERYFADGWLPKVKPVHVLAPHRPYEHTNAHRERYDEYIANLDFEFGRLMHVLNANGALENTYIVVTSDHGELFERGIEGHVTPVLYDPVVRVPLMISAPGQQSRRDIHVPTSSIDVLPTLARLAGAEIPPWCEGQLLPGFGSPDDAEQSVFMMDAKENSAFTALRHRASFALRKGPYKIIGYKGFSEYGGNDRFELYDIENDPEEMSDLYPQTPAVAKDLREELLTAIDAANARFTA